MSALFDSLFNNGPFMPHGHCYLWTPGLVWLHVVSDALIVFSYFTIPITLIYFVRKRKDMRFGWMFLCFAVFIVACGTSHLMEIWNVWHANYWISGGVKAITALSSVPTAFLLTRLVSPALMLPSLADLERLNLALEQEVVTRSAAEESVRKFNVDLEHRVDERTAELHVLNTDLRRQVDERERAQAAVVQSNEQFRQLADSMPQIVWTARPDGVFDYTNRRWYEYIEQTEEAVSPADWHLNVHPDDLASASQAWAHAIASGLTYTTEFRLRRADGTYRWFLVRALPIRGTDGTITRWFGTCTDVNEQRALLEQNAQLLESERAARSEAERVSNLKDEFLSTLSHELRTPLNAVMGWAQVLQGQAANVEDVEQGLATIERNARAQKQIIDDLLDMSAIISGKVRMDVQRIDLAPVVAAAIETMRPAAEAKGIRLQTVLDPQARPVSGDLNRLQQIFWNLLSNAIKFTPKGGRVQVLLERVNSHLEVSIIDSGEGITPEFLPYVFDRFRQQDASMSRRHGGLGLGLAIVKHLVELHGGTVRVKSGGSNQGASFMVTLPLRVVHPESDTIPDLERHHPGISSKPQPFGDVGLDLTGVKVLVVDDEADARVLVKRVLEDCGAAVGTAGSAAEAMESITTERPDVLVSDIGMPGESGYDLIRRVRNLGPEHGGMIPALALTAYARSEDRMKAIRAGFQMHMAKPVEAAELLTMVSSLAGRSG